MDKFNIENLFLTTGLYDKLDFPEDYKAIFRKLFIDSNEQQFDCFCLYCKKESTFKFTDKTLHNSLYRNLLEAQTKGELDLYWNAFSYPIQLQYTCQRDHSHKYSVTFISQGNNELIKIGQFPSIADIEKHSIAKYRKILKSDYEEFSKAIGLYSHSIGVGSFVYLRRIFENLIEECKQKALLESLLDVERFRQSKMDEKIKMLEEFLPSFLVENRKLYSILSKGIHELTEDECLELFPNVQLAIELILDEKIHQIEKQSKIKSVSKFIADTSAKLKK
ncbi:hypothetical protein BK709_04830 [Bacillus thuringiensis serovar shandongiensis]|uniref:hypothetical protein n=1 Tax=Bacillus toyonensis TaxID=155322 RepID=UPI000B434040|nr:hypothetical protein [Bacillus toyonensis]MEC2390242.1 hypothetical protein [Bacillus toyonensis]OTX32058.1 hypothetical protein BK717_20160 [Bacillus thuringiensis serovar malayensis]OUB10833.1 hypothetical protein BK709_04830 [Bacillus thuringiensis serovar shandongiensis]